MNSTEAQIFNLLSLKDRCSTKFMSRKKVIKLRNCFVNFQDVKDNMLYKFKGVLNAQHAQRSKVSIRFY